MTLSFFITVIPDHDKPQPPGCLLGIKRLDDSGHILPWQNLLHAGEENLFSGLTALSAEFTIGEGELMAHDVPLGCAPDEYDDLISGTCSHLP